MAALRGILDVTSERQSEVPRSAYSKSRLPNAKAYPSSAG